VINYYLSDKADGEVTLEIMDATGKSVRKFSSYDKPYAIPGVNIPLYWIRPQQILSAQAGSHRFLWDLHYSPIDEPVSFPMTAIFQNTAPDINAPWVMPGNYTVKLTVNGKTHTQPLTVKMDPRVKTGMADLQKQHSLSVTAYEGRQLARRSMDEVAAAGKQLKDRIAKGDHSVDALTKLEQQVAELEGAPGTRSGTSAQQAPGFARIESAFAGLFNIIHDTEMPPTTQTIAGTIQTQTQLKELKAKWDRLKKEIESVK
jgi:hypothetical protein